MSSGDQFTVVPLDTTFKDEMGLATQQRGRVTTAAGKGYWPPSADQPAQVDVAKYAIAFFMFESASSLYMWDAAKQEFRRVWISD